MKNPDDHLSKPSNVDWKDMHIYVRKQETFSELWLMTKFI